MIRRKKKEYSLAAIYDTETSNIGEGVKTKAICILYIFNDIRKINLRNYQPDKDDDINFYRYESEALNYIDELVDYGYKANVIPIICAYNLMFDMQTLMHSLNEKYEMKVNAQSSTNVYTLDLLEGDEVVLRFWDTFHLEMRGLSAMGETCGLGKALGEWDYSKIRTCETILTERELFYAKRDVQVIPAYLKYLLNANEWLDEKMLGCNVLTKTSLVRQMARKEIGKLKIDKANGKQINLEWSFEKTCKQQLPKTYESYATRKACFRGGLTFTSGLVASKVIENVASLDVTSMHHAFINGRRLPIHFSFSSNRTLDLMCNYICKLSLKNVLKNYDMPFDCAFHAKFAFKNIRIKKESCFGKWIIPIIPSAKFRNSVIVGTDYSENVLNAEAENEVRKEGYHDYAENPIFAFGKLIKADYCELFLSELELWNINQVYEWDDVYSLFGESTVNFTVPPDYVTLQSNKLFEAKNDAKIINNNYRKGECYKYDIPNTIPVGIATQLINGTCEEQFFSSYYNSTVKGMFNGIYGTMAQDVFKPDYSVEDGTLHVNVDTKTTKDNYEEKIPNRCKVLYTYGLRIVGGSRMHLIIAMILLYDKFGNDILISGGDTDSLKIKCEKYITNDMLLDALKPLHKAIRKAIDKTMCRVRKLFPQYASKLNGIGEFEIEKCGNSDRWLYHMEAWNKARVSISKDMKSHVTCAGLSRPIGKYTIENYINDMLKSGVDINEFLPNVIGYNVFITHELCFALERNAPKSDSILDCDIIDYLGNKTHVNQKQAIALYPSGRMLGDTKKRSNSDNVVYLNSIGRNIDSEEKWIQYNQRKNKVQLANEEGVIYEVAI